MDSPNFYALPYEVQVGQLAQAGRKALLEWPQVWSLGRLIKFRENAVFEINAPGERAVLRIHRPGYHDDQALMSELIWMHALSHAGIPVPELVPAADGELSVALRSGPLPETRRFDVLRWIDGAPLSDIEDRANFRQIYFDAGALAARLHNHSRSWKAPANFSRPSWDADGLAGVTPLWGAFDTLAALTHEERDLLVAARSRALQDLAEMGQAKERYGLIHADFVPENLIFGPDGLKLIDFDDCGFGWHMFELATALFFQYSRPDFEELKSSLLAGYRSVRRLPDKDRDKLVLFLVLRSFTYLGWVGTRPETETARELTPFLISQACLLAKEYLHEPAVP